MGITGVQFPETHLQFQFLVSLFSFLCMLGFLDTFKWNYRSKRTGVTSMNTNWTWKESSRQQTVFFKLISSREDSLHRISLVSSILTQFSIYIILYCPSKDKQVQHQFFSESSPASSNHSQSHSSPIPFPTAMPVPEDDLQTKFTNKNSKISDYCEDNSG